MRILIGCEESGVVRDAMNACGNLAYSNDILPARRGGRHLQMCVKQAIKKHGPWDIIIVFPDCTKLALSGNRWYGQHSPRHQERLDAIAWTVDLWNLCKKHARVGCALENPSSVIWQYIGKPQFIQPHNFGHKEVKTTGILTHNLPALSPLKEVGPPPPAGTPERKKWERVWRMARSEHRKRDRSETLPGVAVSMALQWAGELS